MLRNQTAYVEARQGGLTNRLDYRAIKIITGRICISQIHVSWKSGGPAISYHIGAHCRIGLTYRFSYRLFQRKFRVADGWIYDVNDMAACCQVYNYRLRMRSIFLYTDIYIYICIYIYTFSGDEKHVKAVQLVGNCDPIPDKVAPRSFQHESDLQYVS